MQYRNIRIFTCGLFKPASALLNVCYMLIYNLKYWSLILKELQITAAQTKLHILHSTKTYNVYTRT